MVDCTGIEFRTLHKALWDNSKIAAYFEISCTTPPNYEEPRTGVWGFDYHCGRVFKTDFEPYRDPSKRINGKIIIDPMGYDRDNGNGALQSVGDSLKSASISNSESKSS